MRTTQALALAAALGSAGPLAAQVDPRNQIAPKKPLTTPAQWLAALGVNPVRVVGGTPVAVTVTLVQPAPQGGVTVTLSSSRPGFAPVPPSVGIRQGGRSATITVNTSSVGTCPQSPQLCPPLLDVDIVGRVGTAAPMTARLQLAPTPILTLQSLWFTPMSIPGGSGATGLVRLTLPAPAGGFEVTLDVRTVSGDPAIVTLPPKVTIAAGEREATFAVTTKKASVATRVHVIANSTAGSIGADLWVSPRE